MKKVYFLLLSLLLVFVQGLAQTRSDFTTKASENGFKSKTNGLSFNGESASKPNWPGLGFIDGIVFVDGGVAVGTQGSSGGWSTDGMRGLPNSRKIWVEQSDGRGLTSLTYSNVAVNTRNSQYITVKSFLIKNYMTLSISGNNKNMFYLDTSILGNYETDCGANFDKKGAKVKVTYYPTSAGTHTAKITIKEHVWFFPKKATVTLTGTAVKRSYASSVNPADEFDTTLEVSIEYDNEDEDYLESNYSTSIDATSISTITGVDEIVSEAKIYAEGQNIVIESPVEQSAVISDVAGRAWTVNLQVGRNEIPVNASGIFIVRVREKTAKLMLR